MGVGIVLRNVSAVSAAALAARAEDAGISEAFFPETGHLPALPVTGRDPFALAAAALRATTELRAGPGVAVTVFRAPRQMAVLAGTIDEESNGRFLLGCGVSHTDIIGAAGGYPKSPLTFMRDYCGELMQAADSKIGFGHRYPVLVGALGDRMIELAARHSDGVILNWLSTETVKATTARIAELSDGVASTFLFVRVGPSDALRADAETYRSTLANYRRHFERQQLDTVEEIVDQTCVEAGDTAGLVERLTELRASGLGTPCIYPIGMPEHAIDALLRRLARTRLESL